MFDVRNERIWVTEKTKIRNQNSLWNDFLKFYIPLIIFDWEELDRFVRIEFSRPLLYDDHDFDDRIDRYDADKYLHRNGDKRTTQFEQTNISERIKLEET